MAENFYQDLEHGIHLIDAGLYRHGQVACYLLREGSQVAVIDTGTSHTVSRVLGLLSGLGLSPANVVYVIPTHVHLDHAGGAGALMAECPNATLVVHPNGARHMIDPQKLVDGALQVYGPTAFEQDFGHVVPVPEQRVLEARDGMTLGIGQRRLEFVDSPGHANHHFCVFDQATASFFTGDTFGVSYREFDHDGRSFLFAPTTPVAFDPDRWLQTLDKLMARNPSAMLLTHYGRMEAPDSLVGQLRDNIKDLAEIAYTHEETPAGPARIDALKADIEELLLAGLTSHGCPLDSESQRRLLAVDIELNAQGLEIWLLRRARRKGN